SPSIWPIATERTHPVWPVRVWCGGRGRHLTRVAVSTGEPSPWLSEFTRKHCRAPVQGRCGHMDKHLALAKGRPRVWPKTRPTFDNAAASYGPVKRSSLGV